MHGLGEGAAVMHIPACENLIGRRHPLFFAKVALICDISIQSVTRSRDHSY